MGINFQNVNFSYQTQRKKKKVLYVLKDINVNISNNSEFIALVGHTGSGKSTMVQLMNALLLSSSGTITVFDKILNSKTRGLKSIRKKVGVVFQFPEYQLFEETVLKDVEFGPKNFGMDINESLEVSKKALEMVGLGKEYYDKSPFGLSGGEMRKVAIAGILASQPDILVFDEPTVGLDPSAKEELIRLLKKLNEEEHKSIIIITHDMDVVVKATKRAIVLDNGSVVYDGKTRELFKDEEMIRKHSLDYPSIIKLLMKLKQRDPYKDIDIYQFDVEEAYNEIMRVTK